MIKLTKEAEKSFNNAITILQKAGFEISSTPNWHIDCNTIHICGSNVPMIEHTYSLEFSMFVPKKILK